MVREDQEHRDQPAREPAAAPCLHRGARSPAFKVAAVALTTVCVAAASGFLMAPWLGEPRREGVPAGSGGASAVPAAGPHLFQGWSKPEVALVLSGEEHGYLQPCGCSRPQLGGLARRFNFVKSLRERGWPVVAVDLGDVPQRSGPQALLKYVKSMEALDLIKYAAVGIGQNEGAMPLFHALGEYSLNNQTPRVLSANLMNKDMDFGPGVVANWEMAGGQGAVPKVAVIGVAGRSVANEIQTVNPGVRFEEAEKVLPQALAEVTPQRPALLVLLFQGTQEEAKAVAEHFQQFDVILCKTREEEPSGVPVPVGKTLVIGVGHKGRYVGVVGAIRSGAANTPLQLRYQLVAMSEDFETPQGQDASNPIHGLLERYAREVKDGDYLKRYAQTKHPLQVTYPNAAYVGSEKCKKCHEYAYDIWMKEVWNPSMGRMESHAHAYADLVSAQRPSLRQFDGECVRCHVVGFGYQTGFRNDKETPLLLNVGCESCHGPGSLHVKGNKEPELLAAMNPYKTQPNETAAAKARRINLLDQSCQKCHDADNDVHWDIKKWEKIVHNEPGE